MTQPHTSVRVIAAVAGSALGAAAAGQARIEYTKDGRSIPVVRSLVEDVGFSADGPMPLPLTPGWTLEMRRQVGSVRIGDLNGDGINDLSVGCYTGSAFPPYPDWDDMIFYGTGSGLPAGPSWISADEVHTGDTQLADINGDGSLDLVAITGGTAFSPPRIYFGALGGPSTSPGWMAAPPTAGWATGGLVFDVDVDGDLDLLTTNQGVSPNAFRPMYLFLNGATGGGPLSTSVAWQSVESSIQNTAAAADFNSDGRPDVAVSKWVNFESAVYYGTAALPQTVPSWTIGATTADRGVATGDVNGDGVVDVAFGGPDGTRVFINNAGTLAMSYMSDPPFDSVQEVLLADLDLDGDRDLVEVHFGDGRAHVYLNQGGSLSVTPSWTFDATQVGNAVAVGDLNSDGRPDLAVGYSGDTSVRVFFGQAVPGGCYANCDQSTAAPVLNVADFTCFLQRFAAGESYANCDESTAAPVLNVADFTCFLQRFAAGCP